MTQTIYAVDYDGTLLIGGKLNGRLLAMLKREQAKGNVVILWTCREGKSLGEAVEMLRRNGFMPNCINCNHPLGIKRLGHDSRKIYADVYIDDKSAR